jgi:hypothetical protein
VSTDGDVIIPNLRDVRRSTLAAQVAGNHQAIFDDLDVYASASAEFRPIEPNYCMASSGCTIMPRAIAIARWLIDNHETSDYATQLFFRLANAVGRLFNSAELDDAAVAALILAHAGDRPARAPVELALFVALVLRRPLIFEDAARAFLGDMSIPLEIRLAVASSISKIYWNMWKANKPWGYDGISPELHAAYFIPNRYRFEFITEIVGRIGLEFAAEVAKQDFIRRRPLRPPWLKLCFLVEDFGSRPLNTTTKLIVDYAHLVTSKMRNVSVNILVAKNDQPSKDSRFIGVFGSSRASLEDLLDAYEFDLEAFHNGRLTLGYLDAPTGGGYVQRFVDALVDLRPDCIVLFPVPHFVLEPALNNNFPVVAVELVNGMLSSELFDVVIPNGKPHRATVERYGDRLVLMPLPDVPFIAREKYTRKSLGYPEHGLGIVVASVGINFERRMRMHAEHEVFWRRVSGILRAHPDVIWQLVGIDEVGEEAIVTECPELQPFLENGQLRCKAYETDLRAFLQYCDIYAHPPIPGGGRGVSLAAPAALPIVCYSFNDAANFLPENQLYPNHDEYFLALRRLIQDPELRQQLGASNSRILGDDYFAYAAQGMIYAAFKAMERYNERQGLSVEARVD